MIGEPTRVTLTTSTLIDHVATNKPENVVASGIFNITLSDHYLVFVTRKFLWAPQNDNVKLYPLES